MTTRSRPARALTVLLAAALLLATAACGGSGGEGTGTADGASDEEQATTTTAPSTTTTVDPAVACVGELPLRQRAAQTLAIAIDGGALGSEAQRVADLGVGGVILQRPAGDVAGGITQVKEASAVAPLVMVDEEGGESQVLRPIVGPLPGEPAVVAAGDPAAAEATVAAHAAEVAALGVDVVLGPVIDVATTGGGGPVDERSFSSDPAQVEAYGQAYVDALLGAGLTPVLKHFPGHGPADGNSHDGPVSVPPLDDLRQRDLLPFEQLATGEQEEQVGVMVAHVVVPDLTGFTAASQSPEAIDGLLRDELGFDGLVMTDSLSMGAIAFRTGPEQSFPQAIAAGADLALFVTIADPAAAISAMEGAVQSGQVPEERLDEAVANVLAAKGIDPCTL